MTTNEVVIVSAVRTPIGSFLGGLQNVKATDLGAIVIKAALEKAGVNPSEVDDVIMGNVLQAGLGQNPARQAALAAGLPQEVSSITINKVCGSGLKAVHLATQAILAGDAEVIVAGGMENMTEAELQHVMNMVICLPAMNEEMMQSMMGNGQNSTSSMMSGMMMQ